MIYLDFAKAFDSVDHTILSTELRAYGVSRQLLAWFADYLTGRAQRVVLHGATSRWAPVTSGVLQGSLLGPLFFTIFINDLPGENVGGMRAALYADDTKLQTTQANVDDWSKGNNINFNTYKCTTLTVTRMKTPLIYDYILNNTQLLRVSAEKDQRVIITGTLSWHSYIYTITT